MIHRPYTVLHIFCTGMKIYNFYIWVTYLSLLLTYLKTSSEWALKYTSPCFKKPLPVSWPPSLSLSKRNRFHSWTKQFFYTTQKLITRPHSFLFRYFPTAYCRFSLTEPLSWFRDRILAVLFSKQKTNDVMPRSLFQPWIIKPLFFH